MIDQDSKTAKQDIDNIEMLNRERYDDPPGTIACIDGRWYRKPKKNLWVKAESIFDTPKKTTTDG